MSTSSCPTPVCPVCKAHETCRFILQSVNECSVAVCQSTGSSSSNAGAIAGGVVGGIVGLLLLVGVGLWFYFRNRRSDDMSLLSEKYASDGSPFENRSHRPSVAASITTVNTNQARESNVIPVAYIPGVAVLPPMGERGSGIPSIRNSIATTNYRASVPEMVMAVQGQPNLIQITGDPTLSNASLNSMRPPPPPMSRKSSQASTNGSARSGRSGRSVGVGSRPENGSGDVGSTMVAIPEDSTPNVVPLPRMHPPNLAGESVYSSRVSSTWSSHERMSTVSHASSTGEYLSQLPEEAYLYHGGGFDSSSARNSNAVEREDLD